MRRAPGEVLAPLCGGTVTFRPARGIGKSTGRRKNIYQPEFLLGSNQLPEEMASGRTSVLSRADFGSGTKLQRTTQTISADMGDEVVMLDVDQGTYFGLKGCGGYIWSTLERPVSIDDIVALVRDEFDTRDFGSVEDAVGEFVGDLFESGLVILAE